MQLTLIADVADVAAAQHAAPSGYATRTATPADVDGLGALYFASYPAGVAGANLDEATADIRAAFDGDFGELWLEASLVAERDGDLVGAIRVVHSAPWDDVPPRAVHHRALRCLRPPPHRLGPAPRHGIVRCGPGNRRVDGDAARRP